MGGEGRKGRMSKRPKKEIRTRKFENQKRTFAKNENYLHESIVADDELGHDQIQTHKETINQS